MEISLPTRNMNVSNSTNRTSDDVDPDVIVTKGAVSFFIGIFCLSIIGDFLAIVIIGKTPTLRSYTGHLLINHLLSDIGNHIISCLMIVQRLSGTWDSLWGSGRYVLGLLFQVFHGVTAQTLAAISLNLFVAICHREKYRKRMSKRCVAVFIPACWIVNTTLCLLPWIPEVTLKSLYIARGAVIVPSYHGEAKWTWITIVTEAYTIPALITMFAFVKIHKYSQKIQPITNGNLHFRDKYVLSQVIVGISVSYTVLWILLHVFRALQGRFEDNKSRGIFQTLALTAYLLNVVYGVVKLPFYMWVYTPMRVTAKQLLCPSTVVPA